jgi:hypothetical protein
VRSVAEALSIVLVLSAFAVWLAGAYYEYRFFRLWRREVDRSQAFTLLTPFLYRGSAECNALGRRANLSKAIFLALCALGFICMSWLHGIGVYPVKP